MIRLALSSLALTSVLVAGCSDDPGPGLGSSCTDNDDCASGLCYAGQCIDPDADPDEDTLASGLEVGLGLDPNDADTDNDDVDDPDELDGSHAHVDTDEDGTPDALESAVSDDDQDCLPDQEDAENTVPAVPTYCEPEFELSVSGDDLACPAIPNAEFSAYSADQNWTELVAWSAEIDGIPTNEVTFSAPGVATVSASATTGTVYTIVAATRQQRAMAELLYNPDGTGGECLLPR